MTNNLRRILLRCRHCDQAESLTDGELLERLQQAGLLRRVKDPEWALVEQLLAARGGELRCPACAQHGLQLDETPATDDEAWDGRACERCAQTIPAERLEAFPDATLCVSCQQGEDRGDADIEDYCPRCGTPMIVRAAGGGGLSRYQLVCPQCRR